jgi:glycine/D-amino acid oxidase-like deaminating enzyme
MDRRRFGLLCVGAVTLARRASVVAAEGPRKIVVVGGGIIGASIAFHLARRGAAVTLCEKERPAAGATEKSFAWINATFSKQPRSYFELNRLGMAAWEQLDRELGRPFALQWGGSVEWYPAGEEAEALRRDLHRHQEWGYAARIVEDAELRRLLPGVVPGPVAAASFSDQEGSVDPVRAVDVLIDAARKNRARIVHPCEVTGFERASEQVRAVRTTVGMIEADAVVLACGVGTPRVAALLGFTVPLKDAPGVLAHSAPQPMRLERVALAPGAHVVQRHDGRVVTGSSFGGSPVTVEDEAYGRRLLQEAVRFLPAFGGVALDRVTLGWRVMPKDELPIVGFTAACPNVYVAAMHSGITLAPLVGRLVAAEILDGVKIDLLEPYRLSRFA